MRLGLTRLFADNPWLTLLIIYLATTVQIQARDYSSARDLYEKRRRWGNVEDILELAGLKKRDYHNRYGYRFGHSEIRRHPGSYGRKNWSNERQNYEIALLEAKADSVPSWSHAIDDKDTIYDIERDLAQWTPVDLAKESQEMVESATTPKDSEESDLQDLEKEMDEASWTLASTFATKAPVVLDYASVVRNHPRYTTRMRPNTEATLTSKVPEIGKVEVKKPAKLIEDKKAISRKRRNRFNKAPSPAEIAKNLLELDKLDFDLTGQSAHPAIEFVNKLGDQIESEELKTIAARYTPNYMVRDGILYRKDNTPIANLRPPSHSVRASAADNYQKRKEQGSSGDISPAKLKQLIKDDQTKVASSNVLLEESNDNYKAILRPGQLQQRINQAVAIPMEHHTITQSNYVKPVEPVIEPKKHQKPHKHKQSYQKLHRQSGLTIKEFGPDEIDAAPTMPTRTKYRKMVEFIDDNNIEDITAPTEEVAEEGSDANSNEIWNERKIPEMPPPFPFSHCYMNANGFMCCNRYLESLIRKSYQKLKRASRFTECSIQKIANRIQNDCEKVFNTTFEVIVGLDDFAIKAHFASDLMCKLEEDHRVITAYSAQIPTMNGVPTDPLAIITPISFGTRKVFNSKEERDIKEDNKIEEASSDQFDAIVTTVQTPDSSKPTIEKIAIPFHELSREDILKADPDAKRVVRVKAFKT